MYFYHLNTKETKKMSQEATGQAGPLQFLRKPWSKPSWKLLPGTWRARRWLGIANMDLPRVNHIWPTWLPSVSKLSAQQMKRCGCLDLSNVFDTVSQSSILVDKLVRYGLDRQPMRWVEKAAKLLISKRGGITTLTAWKTANKKLHNI